MMDKISGDQPPFQDSCVPHMDIFIGELQGNKLFFSQLQHS